MNELANKQSVDGEIRELALFAGAGGGILGGLLCGWRTVCAVEIEPYAAGVLVARQNDGILPPFPIWDDIRTFDGRPWRGLVDVVSGGFPCQDISCAGKGEGIEGSRSGLWFEMARIIREIRPRFALVENSPMLTSRGLGRVLGDLFEMGYDAEWGVVSAENARAIHKRERLWILAYTDKGRRHSHKIYQRTRTEIDVRIHRKPDIDTATQKAWLMANSLISRKPDDVAEWMDRFAALGNGQVPAVVNLAWNILTGSGDKK